MAIDVVIRGTAATADSYFFMPDGVTPMATTTPPVWTVRDFNGNLITSGNSIQDQSNLAHWVAEFSVPLTAPATTGAQRYIFYVLATAVGFTTSSQQLFPVQDPVTVDPDDDAMLVAENSNFSLTLTTPYDTLSALSLNIVDEKGNVFLKPALPDMPLTNSSPPFYGTLTANSLYTYTVPVMVKLNSLPARILGCCAYLGVFSYTLDDGVTQQTEYQSIYVVNSLMISFMQQIRRQVDRIRNNDFIPQLQFTDLDLINCILQGFQYFNSLPPANAAVFTPAGLPDNFYMYVQDASIIKLLEAQYLAEGMTSFEFQGQSVQLTMDRTQYINAQIDRLDSRLQANAKLAKNHWIRSGGGSGRVGAVGGVLGPVSNVVWRVYPALAGFNGGGSPILPGM